MALPKLTTPTYELEIPSTDEKIKYRPFLVKEEKILMMAMETKKEGNATSEKIPANAFLIVHGTKVFPLNKAVVNIGRRMENELTIDDPRVSRNHAQLRAVNGRYVIFDLNSTGGTYVNSQRSHQSVLYPGDVISLAGVPLIFGQDNPPRRADLSETAPFNSSGSERPTALLPKHPAEDDTIL